MADTSDIPKGQYCYKLKPDGEREVCPFWESREEHSAYCGYLDKEGGILLSDQVKICGENK